MDAINDRLMVKRHPSIDLPSKLTGLKIQQLSIESFGEDQEPIMYTTDTLITLNIEPIHEELKDLISKSPAILNLPSSYAEYTDKEEPIRAKATKSKHGLMIDKGIRDETSQVTSRVTPGVQPEVQEGGIEPSKLDKLKASINVDSMTLIVLKRVRRAVKSSVDYSDDSRELKLLMSNKD